MRLVLLLQAAISLCAICSLAAPVPVNVTWLKGQKPKGKGKQNAALAVDCFETFCRKNPALGATNAKVWGTFHDGSKAGAPAQGPSYTKPDTSDHLTVSLYDKDGHAINGFDGTKMDPSTLGPGQREPGRFHLLPGPNQSPGNTDGSVSPHQASQRAQNGLALLNRRKDWP